MSKPSNSPTWAEPTGASRPGRGTPQGANVNGSQPHSRRRSPDGQSAPRRRGERAERHVAPSQVCEAGRTGEDASRASDAGVSGERNYVTVLDTDGDTPFRVVR